MTVVLGAEDLGARLLEGMDHGIVRVVLANPYKMRPHGRV